MDPSDSAAAAAAAARLTDEDIEQVSALDDCKCCFFGGLKTFTPSESNALVCRDCGDHRDLHALHDRAKTYEPTPTVVAAPTLCSYPTSRPSHVAAGRAADLYQPPFPGLDQTSEADRIHLAAVHDFLVTLPDDARDHAERWQPSMFSSSWNVVNSGADSRFFFLGSPGVGKSNLVERLLRVLTGLPLQLPKGAGRTTSFRIDIKLVASGNPITVVVSPESKEAMDDFLKQYHTNCTEGHGDVRLREELERIFDTFAMIFAQITNDWDQLSEDQFVSLLTAVTEALPTEGGKVAEAKQVARSRVRASWSPFQAFVRRVQQIRNTTRQCHDVPELNTLVRNLCLLRAALPFPELVTICVPTDEHHLSWVGTTLVDLRGLDEKESKSSKTRQSDEDRLLDLDMPLRSDVIRESDIFVLCHKWSDEESLGIRSFLHRAQRENPGVLSRLVAVRIVRRAAAEYPDDPVVTEDMQVLDTDVQSARLNRIRSLAHWYRKRNLDVPITCVRSWENSECSSFLSFLACRRQSLLLYHACTARLLLCDSFASAATARRQEVNSSLSKWTSDSITSADLTQHTQSAYNNLHLLNWKVLQAMVRRHGRYLSHTNFFDCLEAALVSLLDSSLASLLKRELQDLDDHICAALANAIRHAVHSNLPSLLVYKLLSNTHDRLWLALGKVSGSGYRNTVIHKTMRYIAVKHAADLLVDLRVVMQHALNGFLADMPDIQQSSAPVIPRLPCVFVDDTAATGPYPPTWHFVRGHSGAVTERSLCLLPAQSSPCSQCVDILSRLAVFPESTPQPVYHLTRDHSSSAPINASMLQQVCATHTSCPSDICAATSIFVFVPSSAVNATLFYHVRADCKPNLHRLTLLEALEMGCAACPDCVH